MMRGQEGREGQERREGMKRFSLAAALALVALAHLHAQQVTSERITRAAAEPHNWLTHNGSYSSQHYSPLTEITPGNVTNLESKWVYQNRSEERRVGKEGTPGGAAVH